MGKKVQVNTYINSTEKLQFAAGGTKRGVTSPRPGFHHGRPPTIKKSS